MAPATLCPRRDVIGATLIAMGNLIWGSCTAGGVFSAHIDLQSTPCYTRHLLQESYNSIDILNMVAQPIGTKKAIAGPKPTGPKTLGPAKKPITHAQTKTVPYKKPAVAPVRKAAVTPTVAAKKPVGAPAVKKPVGSQPLGAKKAVPPAPKNLAKQAPQNKSWLTKTIGAASSGISSATSAAASGIGNAAGAVVTAAGNGVAGAGKGAGARYVPLTH